MTPADKRVMDLLERWLTSIELHLKYADLDDARYNKVQPWPKHERPARWILELAQQKVLSLKTLCKAHRSDNDPSFAESLELMCFLSNLVGAQHIQRFIPLADPNQENHDLTQRSTSANPDADEATREAPKPHVAAVPTLKVEAAPPPEPAEIERTREMPRLKAAPKRAAAPAAKAVPEAVPKRVAPKAAARVAAPTPTPAAAHQRMHEIVIADAVRLLRWGRQWHELAESIARMAERPNITEIRKILRAHKPAIDKQLAN